MDTQKETRLIIRINPNLHQWFKAYAQRMHTTMSTLVIENVETLRNSQEAPSAMDEQADEQMYVQQLERAYAEIQHLRDQLTRRDEQIHALQRSLDQAQQLLAIQTKTTAALTEQNQLLLEDKHKPRKRSFWDRLLYR